MSRPVSRSSAARTKPFAVAALTGAILLAAVTGTAQAQQSPALDRMSISAGAFRAEPKIHLGGDTQYGRVDTPDEKIDDVTLPRVKAELLFGDSHGLSFDYFRFDEDYSANPSGATVYEGRPVSGTIDARANLRLEMARLAYKYWFGKEKTTFGVGLGAAYLRARISGSATANVSATNPVENYSWSGSGEAKDSVWAPTVELALRHSLNEKVRLFAEAGGVKKNGGTVEGHVYNASAGVEWMALPNVALVVDYGIQKIDLHRNGERTADLDLKLKGPSAFVKVRF
ncbi:hypothetical protein LQ564_24260 [Massilia sp. G4R7]|uniref:Outer membrane protein beta-barrel domain-containing protein n=1 Tax=Massilia phyllostachyos TaxID=2898585 RepID=A0ABS8QE69_9BURK|nr:hypothetical protein [Massilia phyllostachyos]MCD2519421.1 hypothetical protein [Massilia phyllostachyos]